jgi:hypothetical protein
MPFSVTSTWAIRACVGLFFICSLYNNLGNDILLVVASSKLCGFAYILGRLAFLQFLSSQKRPANIGAPLASDPI